MEMDVGSNTAFTAKFDQSGAVTIPHHGQRTVRVRFPDNADRLDGILDALDRANIRDQHHAQGAAARGFIVVRQCG